MHDLATTTIGSLLTSQFIDAGAIVIAAMGGTIAGGVALLGLGFAWEHLKKYITGNAFGDDYKKVIRGNQYGTWGSTYKNGKKQWSIKMD